MSLLSDLYARHGHSLRQFVTFGAVGGSGVLVNMAVFALCSNVGHHLGDVNYRTVLFPILNTGYNVRFGHLFVWIAFAVAVTWNFVLNRYWTFRAEGSRAPFLKEYVPFFFVGARANVLTTVLFTVLTNPTSPIYLPEPPFSDDGDFWTKRPYWAQAIAIIFTMPINFVINKLWTFRAVRRKHAAGVAS